MLFISFTFCCDALSASELCWSEKHNKIFTKIATKRIGKTLLGNGENKWYCLTDDFKNVCILHKHDIFTNNMNSHLQDYAHFGTLRAIVIMMFAKCCVLTYIIWQQNSRKLCDAWFLNHTRCFIVGFISSDINYVKNKNFKMKLKSWRITCTRRQKFDVTSNFTCMIMYNNCITFLTRYRNHRMKQT